jgi:enoyl-CoA hydratase/carnithine racemase
VSDSITVHLDGPIGRLTLSNPAKRNALTWRMYDELIEACSVLDADPRVRVVVIRGAGGRAFAAGTDIAQFREFQNAEDGVDYEHRTSDVLAAIRGLRVPVIAAVEGPAVGAGLVIALCSDIVVATPDAVFGVPIARTLGNCLPPAVMARLYASIGRSRALYLLMTAELIDAARGESYGLVNLVIDRGDFAAAVTALARRICASAPLSMSAFKEVDRLLCSTNDLKNADALYRTVYGSRDFQEGVTAFLEKRPPIWEGQ